MMKSKMGFSVARFCAAVMLMIAALPAAAQQILIDKPVKAGELTLFPDLNDDNVYYYVSDKPRLAMDQNGRPQFSFLRYVDNVRSEADKPEAREGNGGGIVHAVVALSVSSEQLSDAKRELQRAKPGAKIQGPVIFKSGKFGLVSSFKDPQGGFTTQVVGLGNAPILDGEKAAVSIQLTKQGAKVLWESFNTPTPDISFTFEMDLDGFRSPHRAVIEADFDQIYEHQAFGAGLASKYLSAEIKTAFDDLQRKGAIKLTQVGADESLEALSTTAYNKITEMMFAPANGTGTPDLNSLNSAAGNGAASLLDRASNLYKETRAEAEAKNREIQERNAKVREAQGNALGARYQADKTQADASAAQARADSLKQGAKTANERAESLKRDQAAAKGEQAATLQKLYDMASRQAQFYQSQADEAQKQADTLTAQATEAGTKAKQFEAAAPPQEEPESKPLFSIAAAYEMKKARQSGTFKIDLNKFTTDTVRLRFDENIGDLRALKADETHFRQVNLDDPLYRQREIVAFIDGVNAEDFGQYVNFVTVHMKKAHQQGGVTDDEVRIDRKNFNKEGNNFKLLYGWKGDNDRGKWMDYQYTTEWSFFGGKTVKTGWQNATSGAIGLAAPYQRRFVELQGEPDALVDAGVRTFTVKIFYDLAGTQQMKTVTLNPAKGQLSEKIEFMLPADKFDYGYEITWRLKGNKTVTSGRQTSSEMQLIVDELPI